MNITISAEEILDLEEKTSDLAGAIASIVAIASTSPEHVTTLLAAVELALQSVQHDLYQLRTVRGA